MVTVLKAGIPPVTIPREITCKTCSAVLQYLPTEVDYRYGDPYRNEPGVPMITCPCCAKDVRVPSL